MLNALVAVLILGFLVIVHEYGHFLVARRSGVRVLGFSIGFGPKLYSWKRGHTKYSLSLIPLGGYVKMAGEQLSKSSKPWDYISQPIGTRARIVLAGPVVNYIVAFLSLWIVFMVGFPELSPVVGTVVKEMPAKSAGLRTNDIIQAIDGEPVANWDELTKYIHDSADKRIVLDIERGNRNIKIKVTPKPKEIKDLLGTTKTVGLIGIGPSGAYHTRAEGPLLAIKSAGKQQIEWTMQTLIALSSLVTGKLSMRESVTGPIGIMVLTSEAVSMGIAPLLTLLSLFSLSLAIFNALPIPILDGGHLLFLGLEKLRGGKPVSMKVQQRATQVSFAILMTFVVLICINDFARFGLVDKIAGWFKP